MIIVKLMGGLGNQMFQYAAARALAFKHTAVVKVDLSYLNTDPKGKWTKRAFDLAVFKASPLSASHKDTRKFELLDTNYLCRKLHTFGILWNDHVYYRENGAQFHAELGKCPPNTYLDGFFQSEKYFKPVSGLIRDDFTFISPLSEKNKELAGSIVSGANAVSIHVRRGDYVTLKEANSYHGLCEPAYYHEAIERITPMIKGGMKFFIFSDDCAWVKQNIKIPGEAVYVDWNTGSKSYEDMRLMSLCKYNIIANSSFSWWGAWLNNNTGKAVVAPKKWFNNADKSTIDLFPEEWILL